MKLLSLHPQIYRFENIAQFAAALRIGSSDVVLTNRCILNADALAALNGASCLWQEDYGQGEPTNAMIDAIRAALDGKERSRIIAIGGGTVLDIAKLLVLPLDMPLAQLLSPTAVFSKRRELLLVPTTCGTGSEMTNISIVSFLQSGVKQGIVSDALYADAAILIPSLLDALPQKPFAASLIDAFIHAVESYLSPKATAYSGMFSVEAMRLILQGLTALAKNGLSVRGQYHERFLLASNLAGIAFSNAGCGAVHAMSYPLGARFHVPHGFSNYTLFLAVLRRYEQQAPQSSVAQLKKVLSQMLAYSAETVYDELERLLACLYPQCAMRDFGVTQADIPAFVRAVQEKQGRLMANACVPLDEQALQAIYQSVL